MKQLIIALLPVMALLCAPLAHAADAPAGPLPAGPAKAGTVFRDCADCGEMVVIPTGSNVFGTTPQELAREGVPADFGQHETPQITITIARPYAIGRTEVTRGQYAAFVKATNRPDPADCAVHDKATDSWGMQKGFNWHNPGFAQADDHPVVCVSWDDGAAYAAWLSQKTGQRYHLPSEEQWEYAARAGTQTDHYWGDDDASLCLNVNMATQATVAELNSVTWDDKLVCTSKHSFTMPVASFDANPFGVYDMLGNAWEWTADCFHFDHTGAPTDGSAVTDGPCTTHGAKGGAYHSQTWLVRAGVRGAGQLATSHVFALGFRVARDLN
jgi:formylglycine-generating enzyme required for sulfatase activity